jgi:hypothetical protein
MVWILPKLPELWEEPQSYGFKKFWQTKSGVLMPAIAGVIVKYFMGKVFRRRENPGL